MSRNPMVVLVVLAALMGACKSTSLVSEDTNKTTTETVTEETRNLGITIPAWDLGISGNIGSRIVWVPVPGKPGKEEPCVVIKPQTQSIISKDSIKSLQYHIDSLGNIAVGSSQRKHEMEVEIKEKTKTIREQTEIIRNYEKKDSWFKDFIEQIAYGFVAIVVLIGGIFYFLNKFSIGK